MFGRHNFFDTFGMVQEFHQKFEVPVHTEPTQLHSGLYKEEGREAILLLKQVESLLMKYRNIPTMQQDVAWGRVQMMVEELREFCEAIIEEDLEKQVDSLIDLDYFVLGTADWMGLPWYTLFHEVHRANMSKVKVQNAEESTRLNKLDVRKPEGWQPPNVAGVIAHALKVKRMLREHPILGGRFPSPPPEMATMPMAQRAVQEAAAMRVDLADIERRMLESLRNGEDTKNLVADNKPIDANVPDEIRSFVEHERGQ